MHVIGNKDDPGGAKKLLELCKGGPTSVVRHEGGHSVPHRPGDVENVAEAIRKAGKWISVWNLRPHWPTRMDGTGLTSGLDGF